MEKRIERRIKRHSFLIVAVAFTSFFAIGLPTGAFTIAWGGMELDLGLVLADSGTIIMVNTIAFAFSSSMLGRLYKHTWLENIDFFGTVILALGLLSIGLAPNLPVLVLASALAGIGAGLIDSSINTYMTQFYTARHMNWLYAFWGAGSTLSPILMAQMVIRFSWRAGYFSLAAILGVVSIIILISLASGIWKSTKDIEAANVHAAEEKATEPIKRRYLTKKWHQVVEVLTCFIYGGMDYTFVFFTTVIMESRGVEFFALFPVIYYAFMMGGRMFFGWFAKWLSDMTTIRIGLGIAGAGVLVVLFTGNIAGMALAGFGFAPVFPSLLHDSSNRFAPRVLSRLVGYEVAAFGAGTAAIFYFLSLVLSYIPLDMLFPISLGLIATTFILNEILERARKHAKAVTVDQSETK